MDDEYGPPTMEDDQWFQIHVVSKGYPRVKCDPKPLDGQMTLTEDAQAWFRDEVASRLKPWPILILTDLGYEQVDE